MESRSIDFAKTASIDIMSLNNKVVNMRQLVKRTKVQVINRLCRNIGELKKKKGTDEQKEKNIQKAERMIEEIDSIKQLKPDKVSKYALANTSSFEGVCKTTTKAGPRAMARLSAHALMSKRVEEFRGQHADWRDLTAFLLIKQTGRRFKTKKQKQGNKHAVNVENINASETMTTTYLKEMVGPEAGKHAEQRFERKRRRKILDRRPKKEKVSESVEKKIDSEKDDDDEIEPKTKKLKKDFAKEQDGSDSDEKTKASADDDSESESVVDAVAKDQSVSDEDDSEASIDDEQDNIINNKIDNDSESEEEGSNVVKYNQNSDDTSGEDSGEDNDISNNKTDTIGKGKAQLTLERKKMKKLSQNGESVVRELNLEDMDGDDIGSEDDDEDEDDEEENDNDNDDSKSENDNESDSREVASDNDSEDSDSSDDASGLKGSIKKSLQKSDILLKNKKESKKNNKDVPDIIKGGVGSDKKVTRDPFFVFDGSDGSDNEGSSQARNMSETNDFYYQASDPDPSFEKRHFDSMFHNPEETEIKSGRGSSRGDLNRGRGDFSRGRGDFNRGRGGPIRGGQFGKKQTMGDMKQASRQDRYRGRGGGDRGRGGSSDAVRGGWDRNREGGDRGRGGGDRGRRGGDRGRGGGRDFSSPRDGQPKRFQTDTTTFKSAPVYKAPGPAEKLHPSWEASKKRKEQSGLVAFKGSKKTFDDSD